MNKDAIAHAATILGTVDVPGSIDFYQSKLGFECTFSWENPPTYAVLKRGETSIHLAEREKSVITDGPVIYIFCNDIEGLYEEFCSRQIDILEPLSDLADYGMREIVIKDNNGYKMIFGSEG